MLVLLHIFFAVFGIVKQPWKNSYLGFLYSTVHFLPVDPKFCFLLHLPFQSSDNIFLFTYFLFWLTRELMEN